ncbi:hypothetical protein Tco_0698551 [Tanacetum coccineum]
MERYSGNLYEFINDIRKNRGRLNRFSRDIIKAMINLPEHILVKKYRSLPDVAKLGGISRYRKVTIDIMEPFKRDVYDMGRTMLRILGDTHIIPDDDAAAREHYEKREPFEVDVQDLYDEDSLAAHLIEQ